MSLLQFKQGTKSAVLSIIPGRGEPIWAYDTKEFFVGDGVTLGGVTPTNLGGGGGGGGDVSSTRNIATQHSLTGGGDLSADRTLSLVNDTATPGNLKVYGTDASGTRGWKSDPGLPVTSTITYATSVTPNLSNGNIFEIASITGALAIGAPTGSPINGQEIWFRLSFGAGASKPTWNAVFKFSTVDISANDILETSGMTNRIRFRYSTITSKWEVAGLIRD